MEQPDIHDDCTENCESQRNKSSNQEKRTGNDLKRADNVNLTAFRKGMEILSGQTLRRRSHRNEMQKRIGTEDNKDQSEKNAGDHGGDFHCNDAALINLEFQP